MTKIRRWAGFPALVAVLSLALALVAALPLLGRAGRALAADEGPVVLTVNGEAILGGDFYQQLDKRAGRQVLEQMVLELLIRQAAREAKLSVTDNEVKKEVERLKANFPTDQEYQAALAKYGLTEQELNGQVTTNLLLKKLGEKDVKVTEDDVKKYYEQHKEQLGEPAKIRARHILVDTREEAAAILKSLKDGADFAKLAQEKSKDPGSKDKGGDLGFFEKDQMVPEFAEAAFALKTGQLSDPVKTQFGYHIIKMEERIEAKPAAYADVKDKIRSELVNARAKSPDQVVNELREKARLDIKWKRYEGVLFKTPPAEEQ